MVLEKEFTMVLYGTSKLNDQNKPEYFFNTFEQDTSSKCPPGIFGDDVFQIPNDSNLILNKIAEFIGDRNTSDTPIAVS